MAKPTSFKVRALATKIVIRDCTECGQTFVRPVVTKTSTVCSRTCRYRRNRRQMGPEKRAAIRKAYKARHPEKFNWSSPSKQAAYQRRRARKSGAAELERIIPADIFERDGWRCQICRRAVDRRLEWPHPKSASLDHIVPLCDGGGHVAANVQLAHLTCNIRKSKNTAPAGDQLRLIG